MPPLSTVAAAALTMALTVGPTAATAEPVPPDSQTSRCAQSPTFPDSADLTPQLTADELREAAELIEQARQLVAELSGLVGSPRATAVEHTLRGAGFTPAIARGWRQAAHDTSDVLLRSTDQVSRDAALVLAKVGFGPTPADLLMSSDRGAHRDTSERTAFAAPYMGSDTAVITAELPDATSRPSAIKALLTAGVSGGAALPFAAMDTSGAPSAACGPAASDTNQDEALSSLHELDRTLQSAAATDPEAQALLDELRALHPSSADAPGLADGSEGGRYEDPVDPDVSDGDTATSERPSNVDESPGWRASEQDLVDKLTQATDDPVAQDLARSLRALGPQSSSGAQAPPGAADRPADEQSADPATRAARWEDLAECESGSDWASNTGNGYYGVIRTDAPRSAPDHCSSVVAALGSAIMKSINASLISRLVSPLAWSTKS